MAFRKIGARAPKAGVKLCRRCSSELDHGKCHRCGAIAATYKHEKTSFTPDVLLRLPLEPPTRAQRFRKV